MIWMMRDEWQVDHTTFSIRSVGSFTYSFNFSKWKKDKGDKANGLTSPPNDAIILTETRSQITTRMISPDFKDPGCWSGRGLNLWPPARLTGAPPTELARWRSSNHLAKIVCCTSILKPKLTFFHDCSSVKKGATKSTPKLLFLVPIKISPRFIYLAMAGTHMVHKDVTKLRCWKLKLAKLSTTFIYNWGTS